MVLQNKYKARASRRYKAKKGIPMNKNETEKAQDTSESEGSESHDEGNDYRRRPKMKDNAWLEPEPEVDLSKLNAKIKALDVNAKPQFALASDEEEPEPEDGPAPPPMSSDELLAMLKEKDAAEEARSLKARLGSGTTQKTGAAAWRRRTGATSLSSAKPAAPTRPQPSDTSKDALDVDEFLSSVDSPSQSRTAAPKTTQQQQSMQDYLDELLG
ncbi:hypothetical protein CBS14141_001015 [Malassezia furfur]|nr:hypothetical protein CBS14141_001015 [Malassezia furfur]